MHLLAEAGLDLTTNPFTTFGALGVMAFLGLWFVKRESARADRLEAKNDALQEAIRTTIDRFEAKNDALHENIRTTIIPVMQQHAAAIEQALEVLRDVARRQP